MLLRTAEYCFDGDDLFVFTDHRFITPVTLVFTFHQCSHKLILYRNS